MNELQFTFSDNLRFDPIYQEKVAKLNASSAKQKSKNNKLHIRDDSYDLDLVSDLMNVNQLNL